jgi:hypothetical protein
MDIDGRWMAGRFAAAIGVGAGRDNHRRRDDARQPLPRLAV